MWGTFGNVPSSNPDGLFGQVRLERMDRTDAELEGNVDRMRVSPSVRVLLRLTIHRSSVELVSGRTRTFGKAMVMW